MAVSSRFATRVCYAVAFATRAAFTLVLATCAGVACSRSTPLDGPFGAQSGVATRGGASADPARPGVPNTPGGASGGGGVAGAVAIAGRGGTVAPSPAPTGGRGGRPGGVPSTCRTPGAALCSNEGDVNFNCGTNGELPPSSGPCAPAGACCHRSSNTAKARERCDGEPLELEYRVAFAAPKNHPFTLGDPLLIAENTARKDRELESLLWRFRLPRGSGAPGGAGDVIVGPGRYNCDGTYSFYSKTAAPPKAGVNEDVARWAPRTSRSTVDAGFDTDARVTLPLASDLVSREHMFMPVLDPSGVTLDSEQVSEGFNFTELRVSDEAQDCIGSRSPTTWIPGGRYETYMPLQPNDREIISLISQTHCQLLAFGILPSASKNTTPCLVTPRCQPGAASCPWKKLPDSLCPSSAAQRELFACHLGDRSNANQEPGYPPNIACSSEAPVSPTDPSGSGASGQCCDPLGASSSLPPCNAYRVVYEFTAVAVEITDAFADSLQERCLP